MLGGEAGRLRRLNLWGTAWVMLIYGDCPGCKRPWIPWITEVKAVTWSDGVDDAEGSIAGLGRVWETTLTASPRVFETRRDETIVLGVS